MSFPGSQTWNLGSILYGGSWETGTELSGQQSLEQYQPDWWSDGFLLVHCWMGTVTFSLLGFTLLSSRKNFSHFHISSQFAGMISLGTTLIYFVKTQ